MQVESEMELLLLSSLLLLSLFISLSLRMITYNSKPAKKSHDTTTVTKSPPGRTGWPVIGEALEYVSMGRKSTPEKFFKDRMTKYSPEVFQTSFVGQKTAVFCGPTGNKFLFSNDRKLVSSWWPKSVEIIFPMSLDTNTNQESIRMRKFLPSFMKPEALQKYVPIMDSIARKQLESPKWNPKDGEITVVSLAKEYTFDVACRLFLSIDDPTHIEKFYKPFLMIFKGIYSVPIILPGFPLDRAVKAVQFIRKEILEIIRQRKNERESSDHKIRDILDHMLTTVDENGEFLSELNIADKVIGLLLGGHDTASVVITFLMKYLAELPHIYHQVLEEQRAVANGKSPGELLNWEDLQKMKYSWNVACEVMRLAPPIQGNFREAITDFTYAGFAIPKGRTLYWTMHTTHMNPEYFPEPEKFDPKRFDGKGPIPYTYVPFGGGPRMCPGKEYARLEILAFMYNLVRKFKWEKVILDEKIIFDPMPMPAKGLPIRLHHHQV